MQEKTEKVELKVEEDGEYWTPPLVPDWMIKPAVEKTGQDESSLMRGVPLLRMHARLTATIWFTAAGMIAGLVMGLIVLVVVCSVTNSTQMNFFDAIRSGLCVTAIFTLAGCWCAFLPALLFGERVVREQTTLEQARNTAVLIALLSHFIGPLTGLAVMQLYNPSGAGSWIWGASAGIGIGSLIVAGLVTIPTARIAAEQLHRIRNKAFGPRGCGAHGYRHDGNEPRTVFGAILHELRKGFGEPYA